MKNYRFKKAINTKSEISFGQMYSGIAHNECITVIKTKNKTYKVRLEDVVGYYTTPFGVTGGIGTGVCNKSNLIFRIFFITDAKGTYLEGMDIITKDTKEFVRYNFYGRKKHNVRINYYDAKNIENDAVEFDVDVIFPNYNWSGVVFNKNFGKVEISIQPF